MARRKKAANKAPAKAKGKQSTVKSVSIVTESEESCPSQDNSDVQLRLSEESRSCHGIPIDIVHKKFGKLRCVVEQKPNETVEEHDAGGNESEGIHENSTLDGIAGEVVWEEEVVEETILCEEMEVDDSKSINYICQSSCNDQVTVNESIYITSKVETTSFDELNQAGECLAPTPTSTNAFALELANKLKEYDCTSTTSESEVTGIEDESQDSLKASGSEVESNFKHISISGIDTTDVESSSQSPCDGGETIRTTPSRKMRTTGSRATTKLASPMPSRRSRRVAAATQAVLGPVAIDVKVNEVLELNQPSAVMLDEISWPQELLQQDNESSVHTSESSQNPEEMNESSLQFVEVIESNQHSQEVMESTQCGVELEVTESSQHVVTVTESSQHTETVTESSESSQHMVTVIKSSKPAVGVTEFIEESVESIECNQHSMEGTYTGNEDESGQNFEEVTESSQQSVEMTDCSQQSVDVAESNGGMVEPSRSAAPLVDMTIESVVRQSADCSSAVPLFRSRSGSTDTTGSESSSNCSSSIRRSSRIRSISVTNKHRSRIHWELVSEEAKVGTESSDNNSGTDDTTRAPAPTQPVKVKSRWRRSSELEMGSKQPVALTQPEAQLDKQNTDDTEKEERLRQFVHLTENDYLTERSSSKELRGMICDCFLTKEDVARGETGCGEDCLNRILMIECGPRCPLGERCTNKHFQKQEYSRCQVFKTEKKGFGLQATEDLPSGAFLMEYVGEVVNPKEFRRRAKEYSKDKNRHYYFMALKSDSVIDATMKGNISRFINHSCDPNAETQKWTVNGELRIGFFTTRNLAAGEELTFDYQFQRYGKEAQKCHCEADNCRGWIGEDPEKEQEKAELEEKRDEEKKKKRAEKKPVELEEESSDEIDATLEQDIEQLCRGGLKNRTHTLTLCRLMVRGQDAQSRCQLLQLLQGGEPACLRLFLDYHGLRLLWKWMVNADADPMHGLELNIEILKTLSKLPILNKTMLEDSKVLSVVERWERENPALKEQAAALLQEWATLKEVFRIPKKERIEQMKEHEREADRGYKEYLDREDSGVKQSYDRHWRQRTTDVDKPRDRGVEKIRKSRFEDRCMVQDGLSKQERRQMFAAKVAKEEEADRQRKLLEEAEEHHRKEQETQWRMHEDQCRALGMDPHTTMFDWNTGCVAVFDLSLGSWVQYTPQDLNPQLSDGVTSTVLDPCFEESVCDSQYNPDMDTEYGVVSTSQRTPTLISVPIVDNFEDHLSAELEAEAVSSAHISPDKSEEHGAMYGKLTEPIDYEVANQQKKIVYPPLPLDLDQIPLPSKWRSAKDERGYTYYYHVDLRVPQWCPPWEYAGMDDDDDDEEDEEEEEEEEEREEVRDESVMVVEESKPSLLEVVVFQRDEDEEEEEEVEEEVVESVGEMEEQMEPDTSQGDELFEASEVVDDSDEKEAMLVEEATARVAALAKEDAVNESMIVEDNDDVEPAEESGKKRSRVGLVQERIISPRRKEDRPSKKNYRLLKEKLRRKKDAARKLRSKKRRKVVQKTEQPEDDDKATLKIKDTFRLQMAGAIVNFLNPHRKPDCTQGRITNTEDFKHLARKLTHFVMVKELKHCKNVNDLICNDSVKHKARDFIKKYMAKFGPLYQRPADDE